MTCYLKGLGLALFAVCALGAVGASSASATTDVFTCGTFGVANCDLTGSNIAGSTTTLGTKSSSISMTCSSEIIHGTVVSGSTSAIVTPTYSGCDAPPPGQTTVDTTGCHYILTGETTSHNRTTTGTETDARFKIDCTKTGDGTQHAIKITAPGCTITVGGVTPVDGTAVNQNLHGVTYDKEGSGSTDDIKVTVTIDGIHFTTSGFICPLAGLPATGNDMTITGAWTFKGYVHNSGHGTGDHVGLTYH